MSGYELRLLDPATDNALYATAYNWRSSPKRHTQPDRMSLEVFAADNSLHLTVGLFNGELQAVYFLHEVEPGVYQAHFTSQRKVSREALLNGAAEVASAILSNGGSEIHAWVIPRNKPLRSFLESLGFTCVTTAQFNTRQNGTGGTTLPDETRNQRREFVKYVLQKVDFIGSFRSQADIHPDRNYE